MFGVLKRVWLPLIIVMVVVVGGFTVYRVRGYFGAHGNAGGSSVKFEDTKPFNPKVVIYEIFSPNGTVADINYLDLNAD
ncbi:MAG: MmpS family transport accessory protein, partial [Mycobacterium sp.]